MARTPLFASLRRVLQRAATPRAGRVRGPSRRDLLRLGGVLPFTAFATGCGDNTDGNASVAVVGGGAAGLMAARTLLSAGVDVTVYEASARTGGRMFTRTGLFPDNKVVELGGELID